MNISEEIEKSFGDGPSHRPVQERIAAGRRLVVRRRIAGVAAAAAVVVVGGVSWTLLPGSPSAAPDGGVVATQPAEPSEDQAPVDESPGPDGSEKKPKDPQSSLLKGELATYADGRLVIRDGWQVAQRIGNPFGHPAPARSVALELTDGEESYWYLLESQQGSSSTSSTPAGHGFPTLRAWADDLVELERTAPPPSPVAFRPGTSELVAVAGSTVVRQQPSPDVPGFARPGDTTAAAEVRWEGTPYFVLARQVDGQDPEFFPTDAGVPTRPTLASFLDHARAQYGSGEGLR